MEKIRDIKQTGNLGPIAGAVANIQTMEIFKYLTGKGRMNTNRFAEIDFMDLKVEWREFWIINNSIIVTKTKYLNTLFLY